MDAVASTRPQPIACLTIGSSDSSGGAGIQGDVKAFSSVGCYAATVVVGVTAQNTGSVRARHGVPLPVVEAQLDAVLSDLPIRAIKVGTTWSTALIELLGQRLAGSVVPVVLDPVMVTAAGAWLSEDNLRVRQAVIEHLFPVADVITPNVREAELLAGVEPGSCEHRELAESLVQRGAPAVVVTSSGDQHGDWFFDGRQHRVGPGTRYDLNADHGVGCAHSAMLAGLLGWGIPLADAVPVARARAGEAVRRGLVHLGSGIHPVDVLDLPALASPASLGCRSVVP